MTITPIHSVFHSPIIKTVAVAVAGAVFPVVIAAVEHPAGGLADALAKNPSYGSAWLFGSYLLHNFYGAWQLSHPSPAVVAQPTTGPAATPPTS